MSTVNPLMIILSPVIEVGSKQIWRSLSALFFIRNFLFSEGLTRPARRVVRSNCQSICRSFHDADAPPTRYSNCYVNEAKPPCQSMMSYAKYADIPDEGSCDCVSFVDFPAESRVLSNVRQNNIAACILGGR